jgi:hypothetical protein
MAITKVPLNTVLNRLHLEMQEELFKQIKDHIQEQIQPIVDAAAKEIAQSMKSRIESFHDMRSDRIQFNLVINNDEVNIT